MSKPLSGHCTSPVLRLGAGQPSLAMLVDDAANGGTPLLLAHIDIDHFASINENMGTEAGDAALVLLGERLSRYLDGRGIIWRHGGDEFIVAIPRSADLPALEMLMKELGEQIDKPLSLLAYTLFLNARIGISLCPEHALDASELLDFAEIAQHQAVCDTGGSAFRLYGMQAQVSTSSAGIMARQIVDAIANDELHLRYQPAVNARDGRVTGMEALLRWHSPTLGMLVPERFMRMAEQLGVIVQIGDWVIRHTLAQARAWRDVGFDDFTLSINVSTLQLLRAEFVDEVLDAAQAHGIPTASIILEINESALTHNVASIYESLTRLGREGVQLCLDNFGTGESSLGSLVRYQVDRLKIARSFIISAPTGSREAAIVRAIIAMSHQLGIKVVANGVETEAQVGFLRRNECDEFQGYLFGEPDTAEHAGQLLRRRYIRPESFTTVQSDRTLLLLDDDENVLRALVRLFRRDGYRILAAGDVRDAFDLLATNNVQVILSDQRMSDMSGTEFLGRVKMLYPDTVRLVLSGYTDLATVTDAINRGAIYRFLTKPWNDDDLREHIRQAFRTHDANTAAG